jgi:hypothetical protein
VDGARGGVLGIFDLFVNLRVEPVDRIFDRAGDQLGGEDETDRQGDQRRPCSARPQRDGQSGGGEGEQALGAEARLAPPDDGDACQGEAEADEERAAHHAASLPTRAMNANPSRGRLKSLSFGRP